MKTRNPFVIPVLIATAISTVLVAVAIFLAATANDSRGPFSWGWIGAIIGLVAISSLVFIAIKLVRGSSGKGKDKEKPSIKTEKRESYGLLGGIGVTALNLIAVGGAALVSYVWQPFDGRLSWWIFPIVMGVIAFGNKIVGGRHEDAGTLKNHRNTYEGINFFYTVLFWVSFIPALVVHLPPIFRWMLENM